MTKNILLTLIFSFGLCGFMSQAKAMHNIEIVENDFSQISIDVKGNVLHVARLLVRIYTSIISRA